MCPNIAKSGLPEFVGDIDSCIDWLHRQPKVNPARIRQGIATMEILRTLGLDETGCMAAILHRTILVNSELAAQLQTCFDPAVVTLFDGAGRLHRLSELSRSIDSGVGAEVNEDNLRKMLITMVDDVRVVLIKLADQLRLLREARDAERDKQQHLSQLTLDVYAPLANRLGIWQLKWEMEDYALRYREPETYHQLAHQLDEKREDREEYIRTLIETLKQEMTKRGISCEVYGRPKHIYSIWKKMTFKGLAFGNLWDIRAVRVVVDSIADCYSALGVVHMLWRHLPGEFDDYIATPKANGYRSIHTVVIGPADKSVEVQIRTHEMHRDNELGVAAHWRYKENRKQDNSIDNKVLWLRQLLEWKEELSDPESLADAFQQSVGNKRVYVFSPKGTVIDLPEGATPIDFAYTIHSDVGHTARGARINGKMAPLGYRLKTGDQVQIQTTKNGSPSRDWLRPELEYVKTQRARTRIQQWFKQRDYDQNVGEGRALLDRELSRLGLMELAFDRIAAQTPFKKTDDLLAALGAGDYKLSRALLPFRRELERRAEPGIEQKKPARSRQSSKFNVSGVGNLLTTMAKCCQPVPGDQIVGFITTGRGVTIHNQSCKNITGLSEEMQNRLVEVDWGQQDSGAYPVEVMVSAYHRSGILHDITQALKDTSTNVLKVNMEVDDENIVQIHLRLEVSGLKNLGKTLNRLSIIQNILDIKRLTK